MYCEGISKIPTFIQPEMMAGFCDKDVKVGRSPRRSHRKPGWAKGWGCCLKGHSLFNCVVQPSYFIDLEKHIAFVSTHNTLEMNKVMHSNHEHVLNKKKYISI